MPWANLHAEVEEEFAAVREEVEYSADRMMEDRARWVAAAKSPNRNHGLKAPAARKREARKAEQRQAKTRSTIAGLIIARRAQRSASKGKASK